MSALSLYAASFAIILVGLSVRMLLPKRTLHIAIGDAGNPVMLRAMRVHSSFPEYVPLGLFLIYPVERDGANAYLIHLLCLGLLVGSLSHAPGVSQENEDYRFRVLGMAMTLATLVFSELYVIYAWFRGYGV